MKPVWIHYYGVLPMTKFGYLVTLASAAAVAAGLLAAGAVLGVLPPLSTLWQPDPQMARRGLGGLIYNCMWWIILACLVAQAFDTFLTLRAFARKEAEQRAEAEAAMNPEEASP